MSQEHPNAHLHGITLKDIVEDDHPEL